MQNMQNTRTCHVDFKGCVAVLLVHIVCLLKNSRLHIMHIIYYIEQGKMHQQAVA